MTRQIHVVYLFFTYFTQTPVMYSNNTLALFL